MFDNFWNIYDTKLYENRFLVGGYSEYLFGALISSLGNNVVLCGSDSDGIDMKININNERDVGVSLKGTYNLAAGSTAGSVRLINKMGGKHRPWLHATICLISNYGIVLLMPGDVPLKDTSDAMSISISDVKSFCSRNSDRLISCVIPAKKDLEQSETPSRAVARELNERFKNNIPNLYFHLNNLTKK